MILIQNSDFSLFFLGLYKMLTSFSAVAERASVAKHLFFFCIHPHFVTFSLKLVSNLLQNNPRQILSPCIVLPFGDFFSQTGSKYFCLIICEILSFRTHPSLILTVDHFSRIQPTHSRTKFPQKICAFHFLKPIQKEFIPAQKVKKRFGDKIWKN